MIKTLGVDNEREKWWIHGKISKNVVRNYYISPACMNAEHRFLAYLCYLYDKKINPQQRIFPITLISYDSVHTQSALALLKETVSHSRLTPGVTHYFGQKTCLVLKGALSGTIAGKNNFPRVVACRPVIESLDIIDTINSDIKQTTDYSSYLIDLLTQTKALITEKGGYIQALIFMLSTLGIDTDAQEIIKNDQIIQRTPRLLQFNLLSEINGNYM